MREGAVGLDGWANVTPDRRESSSAPCGRSANRRRPASTSAAHGGSTGARLDLRTGPSQRPLPLRRRYPETTGGKCGAVDVKGRVSRFGATLVTPLPKVMVVRARGGRANVGL